MREGRGKLNHGDGCASQQAGGFRIGRRVWPSESRFMPQELVSNSSQSRAMGQWRGFARSKCGAGRTRTRVIIDIEGDGVSELHKPFAGVSRAEAQAQRICSCWDW